jgi:hypothetical protein
MEDVGIFYDNLVNYTTIWYILWPFGIFCGHLVYFMVIWYIFPVFAGMLYREKSGNPASTCAKMPRYGQASTMRLLRSG